MMESIRNYILKEFEAKKLSQEETKKMLMELMEKPEPEVKQHEDIAIIGMACKFPDANNTDEYWSNLKSGVNSIKEPSKIRRDESAVYYKNHLFTKYMLDFVVPDDANLDNEFVKGGYLNEIDKFDAGFFRIPPREAKYMEPLQRIFLETAWEAIEDAGYGGNKIVGTKTGVFAGRDNTAGSLYQYVSEPDQMHLTGSWAGIMATRLQYIFNLRGPGLVVDTACSSGMTATHMACRSLQQGDCDMAISGGIHLTYLPSLKEQKSSMDMLEAEDGKVKTFSKSANGTVWGEGVGILLLKPLSKALTDGDNIHAVIKGSAINNDGASNGITAPNADAQEAVIINAWEEAKINPESISYIEAHGTGTILGDPIEIKGLTNAFRKFTDRNQFCGIGSVKTNFGHLVAASGMASIIKVILSLKNKMIPPTLHFDQPNPYIDFCSCPVFVNDELKQWNTGDTPRRAGVSSFGFSGTNCHIVFEEAPEVVKRKNLTISKEKPKHIFTLSARSESVLKDFVNRYIEFIIKGKVTDLDDICFTSNTGRGHFSNRLAFVLKDFDDFKEKLLYVSKTELKSLDKQGIYYNEHKIVPASKKYREPWEITETQRREISAEADHKIQKLLLRKGDSSKLYSEICQLYVQGSSIDWDMLYKGQDVKRVSVPVYPLERIRYWAAPKDYDAGTQFVKEEKTIKHPLFDKLLADSIDRQIFVTHFDSLKYWELNEHRIQGKSVLPGTTYLEMAREAAKAYFGDSAAELRDIVFVSPLVVEDGEIKDVQTIVIKEKDYLKISIVSSRNTDEITGEKTWVTHAEGKIYRLADKSAVKMNISDLKKACSKEERTLKLSEVESPIKFGTRWDNVDRIFVGNDELFIKLHMDESLREEALNYNIHPSLMDNAANMIMTGLGNNGMYLPLSYHSMKVYDRMPEDFYSYIRKVKKSNNSIETFSFDISLIDMEGKVFAEVDNYTIKMVHNADKGFFDSDSNINSYYEINWIAEELELPKQQKTVKKTALIFKDNAGIADQMIARLTGNAFEKVIEVTFGSEFKKTGNAAFEITGSEEDYLKLLSELKAEGINEIIHLSTVTNPQAKDISFKEAHKRGLYSLFYLTKALSANKYNSQMGLKLVSDFVTQVNEEDIITNPDNSSFFGLGKVVAQENQNFDCKFIDIDRDTSLDSIINEVISDNKLQNVVYRKGSRYVPEFSIASIKPAIDEVEFKNEGAYVITGGTGGIGLEIARYIASKNNVNIALINRTKLPDKKKWDEILQSNNDEKLCKKLKAIRSIEESGSKVVCFSADIANEEETNKVIYTLRKKFGRINGIVHAAGIAGDGYIVLKDSKVFNEVTSPKIEGTQILDRLTKQDEMDFFVLFSSMESVTGGNGQGDYVAANTYLNAYAQYRSKKGKRTIAVNWPGWQETGMAFDNKVTSENFAFKSITTNNALEIFEEALRSENPVVYTGKLNVPLLAGLGDRLPIRLSNQIKSIIDKYVKQESKGKNKTENSTEISEKTAKAVSSNGGSNLEKRLAVIWGEVLGISEVDIYENFHDMGGDSILATQLLKEIDKEFPDVISISDVFSYPSVSQLAEYINGKLGVVCSHEEAAVSVQEEVSHQQLEHVKIELTPVQRCFFYRDFEEKNYWNECIPLYMKDGVQETVLRKVIREVMHQHDSLRLVFRKEDGRYVQYLKSIDETEENLFVYNVTSGNIKEQIAAEALKLNKSIDLAEGPLIKFALFKTNKGDYFYSIMHHLVIDGFSMQIIMQDIISNYLQAVSGKAITVLDENVSIVKWAEFINNYALGEEITREIEYWDRIDSTPIEKLPRDGSTKSRKLKTDNHLRLFLLDEKETDEFIKNSCKHYKVTAEIILITALGMVLDRWGGMGKAHMRLCGNGRDLPFSSFDFSRTVGWLSMSYPFLIDTGKDLPVGGKVENIKKALTEVPNMGAGYDILRFITNPARYPEKTYSVEPEIFFNYMGAYGEPELEEDDILLALKDVPEKSPESSREYVINIEGAIFEGKLKIHLEYNGNEYKKETMLKFLEEYKKALADIGDFE